MNEEVIHYRFLSLDALCSFFSELILGLFYVNLASLSPVHKAVLLINSLTSKIFVTGLYLSVVRNLCYVYVMLVYVFFFTMLVFGLFYVNSASCSPVLLINLLTSMLFPTDFLPSVVHKFC